MTILSEKFNKLNYKFIIFNNHKISKIVLSIVYDSSLHVTSQIS